MALISPQGVNIHDKLPDKRDSSYTVQLFSDSDTLFGDFGEIASHFSPEGSSCWQIFSSPVDDFMIPSIDSGTIDYHITKIVATFTFNSRPQGTLNLVPYDIWSGTYITVYSDKTYYINDEEYHVPSSHPTWTYKNYTDKDTDILWNQQSRQPVANVFGKEGWPICCPIIDSGSPELDIVCSDPINNRGAGDGPIVALQYVTIGNIDVSQLRGKTLLGHERYWKVVIPVDFYLNVNTKYWLSIMPWHKVDYFSWPQSFWCFSTSNKQSDALHGSTFYSGFWSEGQGNWGYSAPTGTFTNLRFSILGRERRCL